MSPWDVHLNRRHMKTPPRVDLFKRFVSNWLAHPLGEILNMVNDSRDLLEPNNPIQGKPLRDLTMRWLAQSGGKSHVGP